MLGNWSFGDYYKREAIAFAWELVTEIWEIPKARLWATIHVSDDEAEKLWLAETDMPLARIRRFDKDNFWEMGETGPCGPCSELFVDLGPEVDPASVNNPDAGPNTSIRYREFWNLVFIQYNRDESGKLTPLPEKHVDTGMGFERMVAILQGVDSTYKTDVFIPLLDEISNVTNQPYFHDERGAPHRVIADHIRCLTFAIGDGVMPSNEGRGYVIRRILRRAVLYGKRLGMDAPFIYNLVDKVIDRLGHVFPDVLPRQNFIKEIIRGEEGRFHQTIDRGLELLKNSLDALETENKRVLPGQRAFELYDTYGFPLDLTQILTRERNIAVDEEGFKKSMERQRERSRADWLAGGDDKGSAVYTDILKEYGKTEFLGYERTEAEAEVVALVREHELVSGAHEGETVAVILNRTPFYGESGGQVGDIGLIISDRAKLEVIDAVKPAPDLYVHKCKVVEGEITPRTTVEAKIDAARRQHIAVSHTATHILHHALRKILGAHVGQAGSLVESGRLRFDFTHYEALTPDQLYKIESDINEKVRSNDHVYIEQLPLQEAKDRGALAFFGDKYGDIVRMVQIGDYSKELCGGTHIHAAGEIGLVKIISESSIAAGVRRVEAAAGAAAYQYICSEDDTLTAIANTLKVPKHLVSERIERLLQINRELERQVKALQAKFAQSQATELLNGAISVDGLRVIAAVLENADRDSLRQLVDDLKNRLGSGVVVLASAIGNEAAFVAGVTPDLVKTRSLQAGKIIQEVARIADGRGGGRPDLAQGGGKDLNKMKTAIDAVANIVANLGSRE
jgi:alanyl-tRNA synthetase